MTGLLWLPLPENMRPAPGLVEFWRGKADKMKKGKLARTPMPEVNSEGKVVMPKHLASATKGTRVRKTDDLEGDSPEKCLTGDVEDEEEEDEVTKEMHALIDGKFYAQFFLLLPVHAFIMTSMFNLFGNSTD